jgi:A/G-specific adenine glycosylase
VPRTPRRSPQWVTHLLAWFDQHRRAMPWRDDPRPYRVWISEMMLQQTQVDTVRPYFDRFIERFPTVKALATADQQDVLRIWEGLGYYARARNVHKAAAVIIKDRGGKIPREALELRKLPGIGDYAAAAIASIAHDERIPAIDGNVLRVFTRFWAIRDDIGKQRMRRDLATRLKPYLPDRAGDFNQAVMELGALVCKPRHPDCKACPLRRHCKARSQGLTGQLPVKAKRGKIPHYDVGVAVVIRRGRALIAQRSPERMLGGLWEFPGGKQEQGETIEEAIVRELIEETGLQVTPKERLCTISHAYSHFKVTLHVFSCLAPSGRAQAHEHDEVRWVPVSELGDYPFPTSNRKIVDLLQAG